MTPVEIIPSSVLPDVFPLDKSVYQAVIEEYVDHFSRQDGVVWIGQFGSIGTPGVSDIDLLVVCEGEHCPAVHRHSQEFIRQSPLYSYAFFHDVAVVPPVAARYVLYVHTLVDLRTLWGNSEIPESLEQPDETIVLLRNILNNSQRWGEIVHLCQSVVGLRRALVLSKSTMTSAEHNYHRVADEDYAGIIALRDGQERQRILAARPSVQGDLAAAYLWEAIQTLAQADWDLRNWMIREGLFSGSAGEKGIQLSQDHVVVFDDSHASRGVLHEHIGGQHVTYLPSFYYSMCNLIVQPYLQLQPGLSRVWSTSASEHWENARIGDAARKWNETLVTMFTDLRRVGADPLVLNAFPFILKGQGSTSGPMVKRFVAGLLPAGAKRWLLARLRHLAK